MRTWWLPKAICGAFLSMILTTVPSYGQPDCSDFLSPGELEYQRAVELAASRLKGYGVHIDLQTGQITGEPYRSHLASAIDRYTKNPGLRFSTSRKERPELYKNTIATHMNRLIWLNPEFLAKHTGNLLILEMVVEHEVEHARQGEKKNASSLIEVKNWGQLKMLESNEPTTYSEYFRFDELEALIAMLNIGFAISSADRDETENNFLNNTLEQAKNFYNNEIEVLLLALNSLEQPHSDRIRFAPSTNALLYELRMVFGQRDIELAIPVSGPISDLQMRIAYIKKVIYQRARELELLKDELKILEQRIFKVSKI